jgi:hypothetical protein
MISTRVVDFEITGSVGLKSRSGSHPASRLRVACHTSPLKRERTDDRKENCDVGWVIIHWFELGTLVLLCLNLWFVTSVVRALRETNRWLAFLTRIRWDETHGPAGSPEE